MDSINMSDYASASARDEDRLMTYGLGTCVGIVIYDRARARGYLAHIVMPKQDPEWSDFIDLVVRENPGRLSELEVTLAGAGLVSSAVSLSAELNEMVLTERTYVVDYLLQRGFNGAKITARFNRFDSSVDMTLCLRTGDVILEGEDDNENKDGYPL